MVKKQAVYLSFTLILLFFFMACDNLVDLGDTDSGEKFSPGEKSAVKVKMISVPVPAGGITFPTGINDYGTASVSQAFLIGETEVTWELWSLVHTWAVDNSIDHDGNGTAGDDTYIFANTGKRGGGINHGTSDQHPVTFINWRDSIVFCNALTEYYNTCKGTILNCVYYTDEDYSNPLRISSDSTTITHELPGSADAPYIRAAFPGNLDMTECSADGFRLPTIWEWELAARWCGTEVGNRTDLISGSDSPDLTDGYYWTPGDYFSGSRMCNNEILDRNDNGIEDGKEANDEVAVYGYYLGCVGGGGLEWFPTGVSGTAEAAEKTRRPNSLGLYDMSGNVSEYCFEWSEEWEASFRVLRGGNWFEQAYYVQLGLQNGSYPYYSSNMKGFRPARTPKTM